MPVDRDMHHLIYSTLTAAHCSLSLSVSLSLHSVSPAAAGLVSYSEVEEVNEFGPLKADDYGSTQSLA